MLLPQQEQNVRHVTGATSEWQSSATARTDEDATGAAASGIADATGVSRTTDRCICKRDGRRTASTLKSGLLEGAHTILEGAHTTATPPLSLDYLCEQ